MSSDVVHPLGWLKFIYSFSGGTSCQPNLKHTLPHPALKMVHNAYGHTSIQVKGKLSTVCLSYIQVKGKVSTVCLSSIQVKCKVSTVCLSFWLKRGVRGCFLLVVAQGTHTEALFGDHPPQNGKSSWSTFAAASDLHPHNWHLLIDQ